MTTEKLTEQEFLDKLYMAGIDAAASDDPAKACHGRYIKEVLPHLSRWTEQEVIRDTSPGLILATATVAHAKWASAVASVSKGERGAQNPENQYKALVDLYSRLLRSEMGLDDD